jgi:MFS family permease
MIEPRSEAPVTGAAPARRAKPRAASHTWTLAVAASATLLVLAVFASPVTTVGETARSLHAGVGGETWALSAMSLGLATALLPVGTLADELGRRRVLVWSLALLAAANALAAAAPAIAVLVAARVLQGIAGAGVVAASLAAIGHAFPAGGARTHATAAWGAALGGGIALGPVAAAALAAPLGWRSGYWAQTLAAAALVPAARRIGESRAAAHRRRDVPGIATLGTGMAMLTAGLVEGRTDWTSATTLALLAAGALLLAAFAALEARQAAPMIDLRLFGEPLFVASIVGALFTGLAVIGLMSYSPTMMQRGLGIGLLGSGAVLATWSGTSMLVAFAARWLPQRLASPARLAIGLSLVAAGEVALSGLGTGSSWASLVPGLAIAGIGSGLANAALGRLAVESVHGDRAGMGSGANNTARYLGGAAGVAVVVALVSAAGTGGDEATRLVQGWDVATLACAALCAAGALIAAVAARRHVSAA